MFANALKSISSTNISSNYTISPTLTSTAGPWKIYPAKNKKTAKECSVFVFDKKSLDAHRSGMTRAEVADFKRAVDAVVERLKKEASAIAKLRHPGILEVVEPVEETRGGGLQFVAEAVTASLSGLLQEKDDQERGGAGGRASRYVTEDADGNRRRRELEIDELEIQKGLLQVSKALEFLHENAGLVHGNLTPDAILINAKSDWKLSGLSFCGPLDNSTSQSSMQPINLREVLRHTPSLPRTVQLNLDYTSPDFVIDNNLTSSADMFSLGLLIISLYNSPHKSPMSCNGSLSAYQRLFQSSQSIPNSTNNFLSSRALPKELTNHVLPRLITRRPAQRMTASEFQQSEFFNNILVSTIRFLDTFPAKTANEKSQFLRGLMKVLPSFPKSVMERKLLPALLDELKDKELISLILHNVFKIIELLPSGKRAFSEKVRPSLKEIFVTNAKQTQEKDAARDAGLMVVIEQLAVIGDNCGGKEFKDDVLPIIFSALESPTPSLVDAALRSLPSVLPQLDFSTIKNELFPVIAAIFSKTNSLAIKVRGLQAFVTLCGGSNDPGGDDGLDGLAPQKKKATSSTALDKFTMQEKIVPLIKVIKTKEPAVMVAALNVLRVVGKVADADFVAMEVLPILWSMSLGPLLDLKQFQAFMELIKSLSSRVEEEQTRKLQELAGGNANSTAMKDDFMSFGPVAGSSFDANGTTETDFESLVKGESGGVSANPMDSGWDSMAPSAAVVSPTVNSRKSTPTAAFSWSSPPAAPAAAPTNSFGAVKAQQPGFRTVTPDLASFQPITPTATQFSQPLQPAPKPSGLSPTPLASQTTSINWGAAAPSTSNKNNNLWSSPPTAQQPSTSAFGSLSLGQQPQQTQNRTPTFSLPPPPGAGTGIGPAASSFSGFSLAPPPGASSQAQAPRPQITTTTSTPAFGGLGSMSSSMNTSSMNSLASMGAAANKMGSSSPSMGMGMAAMKNMNTGMNAGNGTSMNSMMGMGMGTGMAGLSGLGQQQQAQWQGQAQGQGQGQVQGQKSGLDKYESLL
ncbi:kinase-like domain-containing protein [Parachaetomium inaequale]|uniref:Kinase-like domain-containing protein n=1 Tax=Parachaetomium inaequale TaxID=2588326 RepID=A0AAN6PQ89_9PEZI|nr:kinase-like domain-containing protein [Parachaetomium inaequale]